MEAMITSMLKIIEEDADTFAKRAEMYYRKRPELTKWVQETYRAYRALAERYDRLSGALQKANNTIATIFPDQHFGMEDEDDDNSTEAATIKAPPSHLSPHESAKALREQNKMNKKKMKKKRRKCSVDESEEEIDKLQKDILVLQTEKEFIKSSYECGIANFWEKHNIITDMQERLSVLQDRFGEEVVIEDDEAQALMAVTAVKSCVEKLVNLYEERIKCMKEAREEYRRVKGGREKLESIRKECGLPPPEQLDDPCPGEASQFLLDGSMEKELGILRQQKLGLESMCEKVREKIKMDPNMSILDVADEIDEHVSKVATLETTASSQIAHMEMLTVEVDELHEFLESLEGGNVNLIHDSVDLVDKLKRADEEVYRVENLYKVVQDESCDLQKQFTEAHNGLNILFGRIQTKDDKNETEVTQLSSGSTGMVVEEESTKEVYEIKEHEDIDSGAKQMSNSAAEEGFQYHGERKEAIESLASSQENHESRDKMGRPESEEMKSEEQFRLETNASLEVQDVHPRHDHHSKDDHEEEKDEEGEEEEEEEDEEDDDDEDDDEDDDDDVSLVNWQEMFLADLEDREKVIMAEYTSIIQSYKELKKKLIESDRKYQDNMFQNTDKMRDLKNSIIMKDEEIRSLRQQLQFLAASLAEDADVHVADPEVQDFIIGASGKVSRSTSITSLNSDAPASSLSAEPEINQVAKITNGGGQISNPLQRFSSRRITVTTPIEGKFRKDIDQLMDDNLEFWLRFQSSLELMQKYKEEFEGLEHEITVLVDQEEEDAVSNGEHHQKDCATRTYKNLKGLQSKMSDWIQENVHMNEELHSRFSSLSDIEQEILRVAKEGGEGGMHFTAYNALKFQGEVVNMRQDNNHVAGELHSSMDHIRSLQAKVPILLEKLDSRFEISTSKSKLRDKYSCTSSKIKVPLSVYLFGTKRKRRHSIFCCMNPSFQRQFSDLTSGVF